MSTRCERCYWEKSGAHICPDKIRNSVEYRLTALESEIARLKSRLEKAERLADAVREHAGFCSRYGPALAAYREDEHGG